MTKYYYHVITENGSPMSGSIDADSVEGATNALVARGYIPQKITDSSRSGIGFFLAELQEKLTPVKLPELILFTKQLKTLIHAGVPMLKLLQVLESQSENIKLKRIIVSISQDIREGGSLYDGFRKYPSVFSPLYCSMLHAGETSGALPEVLELRQSLVSSVNEMQIVRENSLDKIKVWRDKMLMEILKLNRTCR